MTSSHHAKSFVVSILAAGFVAAGAFTSGGASGQGSGPRAAGPDRDLAAEVNALLGLQASTLQRLAVQPGPDGAVTAHVTMDGVARELVLQPATVRSGAYELLVPGPGGELERAEPGPERTLRGTLAGVPGSIAAGALLGDGLYAAVLLPDGQVRWIEPVSARLGAADGGLYAVYDSGDVLATGASCGAGALQGVELFFEVPQQLAGDGVAGEEGGLCEAEVACDADFEFFSDWGSVAAVEARINLIIDTINLQYEAEVGITHVITAIIVRTAEPDPYSATDPGGLLGQFGSHWENSQQSIQRDVAHLFTGKELDGSVIGIAYLNGVCNGDFAYGLVQSDFSGNFECATDLSAHELGHNWGAPHCDCPGTTMHPNIQCANSFSGSSIAAIVGYRNAVGCLDCLGPLGFSYPDGRPDLVDPAGGTSFEVVVVPGNETPLAGSAVFHLSTNGGPFVAQGMAESAPNEYTAVFPAMGCGDVLEYYFTAQTTTGGSDASPPTAPDGSWAAIAADALVDVFQDDFQANLGWLVQNIGTTEGAWERADPVSNSVCDRGNPGDDADGSGMCFVTENDLTTCDSDVDVGSTVLTSPIMDASQGNSIISYWRWYSNTQGSAPMQDTLVVQVSDFAGISWVDLETVGPDGGDVDGGWIYKSFRISDFVELTPYFQIRFIASDLPPGSIVEAGVDGVKLSAAQCAVACPWDCDGSGDAIVNVSDLLALLAQYNSQAPVGCAGGSCDFNGDGCVDVADLLKLLAHYDPAGAGCP